MKFAVQSFQSSTELYFNLKSSCTRPGRRPGRPGADRRARPGASGCLCPAGHFRRLPSVPLRGSPFLTARQFPIPFPNDNIFVSHLARVAGTRAQGVVPMSLSSGESIQKLHTVTNRYTIGELPESKTLPPLPSSRTRCSLLSSLNDSQILIRLTVIITITSCQRDFLWSARPGSCSSESSLWS